MKSGGRLKSHLVGVSFIVATMILIAHADESPRISADVFVGPHFQSGVRSTVGGVRVLVRTTEALALGVEGDFWGTDVSRPGENVVPPGYPGGTYQSFYRVDSGLYMALARWKLADWRWQPYVVGGAGIHFSQLSWSGFPQGALAGSVPSPIEIDERRKGAAATAGLGMDITLTRHLHGGIEARSFFLDNSFEVTGFKSARTGSFAIAGHLGFRF